MELRLNPAIQFYTHHLSRNKIEKAVSNILLVAATAVWILLAVTNRVGYLAICAAFSAAVTSWIRTRGIEDNLVRYRTCLKRLKGLCVKWKRGPRTEVAFKSLVQNVEQVMSLIKIFSCCLACKKLKNMFFFVDNHQ